jgi:hypothetical protein
MELREIFFFGIEWGCHPGGGLIPPFPVNQDDEGYQGGGLVYDILTLK